METTPETEKTGAASLHPHRLCSWAKTFAIFVITPAAGMSISNAKEEEEDEAVWNYSLCYQCCVVQAE